MKTTSVLVPALAILILLGGGTSSADSAAPTTGTFTMGVIEFETDRGEQVLTADIMHIRNSVGEAGFSGAPWGVPTSATENVLTAQVDVKTGIGSATSKTVDVYDTGMIVGTVQTQLEGVRLWTYLGPTFSFSLNDKSAELVNGDVYCGLYTNIIAVKHGVSGELIGLEVRETATGVRVLAGPLEGVAFAYATVTYALR